MVSRLNVKSVAVIIALIFALVISIFPLPGQSEMFSRSAAVVLVTLVFWSSGFVPPFLASLIFFAFVTILGLISPSIVFAGFGSTAVWLIISGFIIGTAISKSGLGQKLATLISPYLTVSYPRLIAGLVFSAMLLGFIMPSSVGRAVVLIPIGMALADTIGLNKGSNGRIGIATALAISCNMPSFAVLPANIPNMILAGSSENLFNITFGYTEYLLLHFPILGIVKSLVIIWLVLRIFPDEISAPSDTKDTSSDSFVSDQKMQKKVSIFLVVTLLFWITDTIHGINPAWVGLVTAIILLLPKWGIVEPKAFNSSVDFATVIFVAGALGLGALVNESGIGSALGQLFVHILPADQNSSFLSFMALSIISTLTGLVATIPGVPTVLTPMAGDLAQITGFSLPAVIMTQVIGFSTVIFPYQVGPLVVAMQLSKEPLSKLLKITLPLTAITVVVLMPLDFLWWQILGWIS